MTRRLNESIEKLVERDRRFPASAYLLVFEGLEDALQRMAVRRHVSPPELIEGIRARAVENWGYLARAVLESWNVRCSGDVGELVFNLVDGGLLVASETDSRADFEDVVDFDSVFDEAFVEELRENPPRLSRSRK
jgi:uncharacterized repeat protein (TIGR04138 family)